MLDFGIYLLYRAGTAIASALPVRVLFAIGNLMGLGAWLLLPKYRRLARRNLEIAFAKEKSPRELRRIARRHFQSLGANLICGVKMGSMPPEKLAQRAQKNDKETDEVRLRIAKARDIPCFISLEEQMACGIGVCLGCAIPARSRPFRYVCSNGPVFDAADVLDVAADAKIAAKAEAKAP